MKKSLPAVPGTYALIFRNELPRRVRVGALGTVTIEPGYLVYVGSAFGPGGLRARIARHARKNKPRHWHIDYLRPHIALAEIWLSTESDHLEHEWAGSLAHSLVPAFPRFGSSDCRCSSHLFYGAESPVPEFVTAEGFSRIVASY